MKSAISEPTTTVLHKVLILNSLLLVLSMCNFTAIIQGEIDLMCLSESAISDALIVCTWSRNKHFYLAYILQPTICTLIR